LKEKRQPSDHEDQKDTDDAVMDPVKDWMEVITPSSSVEWLAGA
jgi:hypothetical protein